MTGHDDRESLPCTMLEQIVSVCDRFEREWKAGDRPAIERYLTDDPGREVLLQRLLMLELELRREAGEHPSPDEYRDRFAGSSTLIDAVFSGGPESSEAGSNGGLTVVRSRDLGAAIRSGVLPSTEGPPRSGVPTLVDHHDVAPAPVRDREAAGHGGSTNGVRAAGNGHEGGRFTLVHQHARGGVGEVWLAKDHSLGREVALKRLLAPKAGDRSVRSRFYREAWITGQLQHPGIVPVYELSLDDVDGRPYYTMRFIKGRTLSESVREFHRRREAGSNRAHELRELVGVFQSVCQVVAYAHSRGVIHRDLKGQNVALGDYGEVMVLDWGMAKVVGEPPEPVLEEGSSEDAGTTTPNESSLDVPAGEQAWEGTDDGSILGTPSYMAPEQALGKLAEVDFRSDVYGLGAMLYEVLTGEPPFRGSRREVLRQVIHDQPVPPRTRNGGAPAALDAICLKCLLKDSRERYETAGDLAAEIRRYLTDEPVSAYREPWTGRARRLISRHRTLAWVTLATLLVTTISLAAATTLLSLAADRESQARARAESSLVVALTALDSFFSKVGSDPQLKARGLEKFQRDLLSQAKTLYEELAIQDGASPRVLFASGWCDLRVARFEEEFGDPRKAIPLAKRALATFEDLARREPLDTSYREAIARALDSLGSQLARDHRPEEARRTLGEAVTSWETLYGQSPDAPGLRGGLAASLDRLARHLCLVLHDQDEARAVLRRTLDLCEPPKTKAVQDQSIEVARADATVLLGYSLALSEFDQARPLLDRGLSMRQRLVNEHPDSFELRSELLDACVLIATAYSNARIEGRVPRLYEQVRQIGDRLAAEHRDVPKFAEDRALIELLYCIDRAHQSPHEGATAEAEEALARVPRSGLALLYAACCYSVASETAAREGPPGQERDARVRHAQSRAIELLREAGRTGLFVQPHHLEGVRKNDPDLAPLRSLEEFRRLVDVLEAEVRAR